MAVIAGLDTNDTLRGTGESDLILGGGGDDFLIGYDNSDGPGRDPFGAHLADQADTLVGSTGGDTLAGGGGADYLLGAGQGDRLWGGAGADVLVGDWLDPAEYGAHTGGQSPGADVFAFQRVYGFRTPAGTPPDTGFGADRDTVRDFRQGEDKFDFTGWENPAHYGGAFIGAKPFVPGPHLQVNYRQEGGDTVVAFYAPVVAVPPGSSPSYPPATATGEVVLTGLFDLTASDFVFSSVQRVTRPFADEHEGRAYRLYDTIFDRTPDAGGLEFWSNHLRAGIPLQAVANGFTSAPEFQARYGVPDEGEFVGLLYRNVLDREGEAEGLAFWTGVLRSFGATRAEVVVGFSEAPEHAAKIPAADYLLV